MKKVTTTCPNCGASFRVTPQQLGARQGQVRCGQCNTLFNGLESLTMADKKIEETAATPSVSSAPAVLRRARQVQISAATPVPAQPDADDNSDAPVLYLPDMQAGASKHRSAWMAGCAALALLLLGQLSFHFRDVAARDMPALRPYLTGFCGVFGCELALPRDASLVTIEASDLKQRPDRPQEVNVTALLRNRADYAMAYPSLELTLTDANNQALATRVIHPQDYLEKSAPLTGGIAPQAELNVKLHLDVTDLSAVGYRLDLFYP